MASSKYQASKAVVQELVQATGQSEEDVKTALQECQGDCNEAAYRLIHQPFFKVTSKKEKSQKQTKRDGLQGQNQRDSRGRGSNYNKQGRGRSSQRSQDGQKGDSSNFQRQRSTRSGKSFQKASQQRQDGVPQDSLNESTADYNSQISSFAGQPQAPAVSGNESQFSSEVLQERQQKQPPQAVQPSPIQAQAKPVQKTHQIIKPGQGSSMADMLKRPRQQPPQQLRPGAAVENGQDQVHEDAAGKEASPYDQEHQQYNEDNFDEGDEYHQVNGFQSSEVPQGQGHPRAWQEEAPKNRSSWLEATQQDILAQKQYQPPKQQAQPQQQPLAGTVEADKGQERTPAKDSKNDIMGGLGNYMQSEFSKQSQQQPAFQSDQGDLNRHKDSAILQSGPKRSNQQAQTDLGSWNQYVVHQQALQSQPQGTPAAAQQLSQQTASQTPPQQPQAQAQSQPQSSSQLSGPPHPLGQSQFEPRDIGQIGNFSDSKYPNLDFTQNFSQPSYKNQAAVQMQQGAYGQEQGLVGQGQKLNQGQPPIQNQAQNQPQQQPPQQQSQPSSQQNFSNISNIMPLYSLQKLQGSQGFQLPQSKQQQGGLGQFQISDVQNAKEGDGLEGQINRIKAQGQDGFPKNQAIHPPNNSNPLYQLSNFADLPNTNDLQAEQPHQTTSATQQVKPKNQYQEYLQSLAKNVEQHPNSSLDPKILENLQNLQQAANHNFGSAGLGGPQANQLAASLQSMVAAQQQQQQQQQSKPLGAAGYLPHQQLLSHEQEVQANANKLSMLQLKQQLYEQNRQNQVGQGTLPFNQEHAPTPHDKEQINKSHLETLQRNLHGFGNQDHSQLDHLSKDQEVGAKIGGEVPPRQFGNLGVGSQNEASLFSSQQESGKNESGAGNQQISSVSNQLHNQIPNQNQVQYPMPMYNQLYNFGGFPYPTPTPPNMNPQGHMFMAYMAQNPSLAGQYLPSTYHQGGYMQPPSYSNQSVSHQNQSQQFQQGNQVHMKFPHPTFVAPAGMAGQAYTGQSSQGFGNQYSNYNGAHNFGNSYGGGNRFQRFGKE